MIKTVTVINYLGASMILELTSPEKSGFVIQEITGLGPSKANINVTELSSSNGSLFNSARVNARNIVLKLKLLAIPTIEIVRQKSYKYFPLAKQVHLIIETDTRTFEVYGYVESNEPDIFTKEESTSISIICPDPNFYALESNVTVFSGVNPMFEFPFSNDSLTDNLLETGELITNQNKTIYYEGDSEVGITIYIHAFGNATTLSIYNLVTREVMILDTVKLATLTGFGIITGDDITISTVKGKKSVQLLRNGVYINILNCLDRNSDWFQLTKGDNVFSFTSDTSLTSLNFRIENQIVYEGV